LHAQSNPPVPAEAAPVTTPAAQTPVAQTPQSLGASAVAPRPIAIVPLDSKIPGFAAEVSGGIQVLNGRAFIAANGTVTAGSQTTQVTLPYRGTLRICATTTVKLAADASVPAGETPGLLIAMDSGAVEASFATGRNSDILMTPDFRILIGGPGAVEVKVRLGQHGDTCVDNAGLNAPYVLVSSIFDGGAYRVQPGQRVMFEHGSLREVVDQEKEPCGCPPSAPQGNDFPLAQSEGLTLAAPPAPSPGEPRGVPPQTTTTLVYNGAEHERQPADRAQPSAAQTAAAGANPAAAPAAAKKKTGFFHSIGRFFQRIFGAE